MKWVRITIMFIAILAVYVYADIELKTIPNVRPNKLKHVWIYSANIDSVQRANLDSIFHLIDSLYHNTNISGHLNIDGHLTVDTAYIGVIDLGSLLVDYIDVDTLDVDTMKIWGSRFKTAQLDSNTFIGIKAGTWNGTGSMNTFIGYKTGSVIGTGGSNVFIGFDQRGSATSQDSTLYIGVTNGDPLISGRFKTNSDRAVNIDGKIVLQNNATISNASADTASFTETVFKFKGLFNLTNGTATTFTQAPNRLTLTGDSLSIRAITNINPYRASSPQSTTLIGMLSGKLGMSGANNILIGYQVGDDLTTGANNVFIGNNIGSNVGQGGCVFIGDQAGRVNVQNNNTFIGRISGYTNSTGIANSYYGYSSGYRNSTSNGQTFVGYYAGQNALGGGNSGFGNYALAGYSSSPYFTGTLNTSAGDSTGVNLRSGNRNIFIGAYSGLDVTNGNYNYIIGGWKGYASNDSLFVVSAGGDSTNTPLLTGNMTAGVANRGLTVDGNITLPDYGTTVNSRKISLTADNSTTAQTGEIQVIYGADPYLRLSAPNDAGTATAIMDLKDQRIVIGAGGEVDYDFYFNAASNQGSITYMEDEDRFDFDTNIKATNYYIGTDLVTGIIADSAASALASAKAYTDAHSQDSTWVSATLGINAKGSGQLNFVGSDNDQGNISITVLDALQIADFGGGVLVDGSVAIINDLNLGSNASNTNGTINFEASDGDAGTVAINTDDELAISGFGNGLRLTGTYNLAGSLIMTGAGSYASFPGSVYADSLYSKDIESRRAWNDSTIINARADSTWRLGSEGITTVSVVSKETAANSSMTVAGYIKTALVTMGKILFNDDTPVAVVLGGDDTYTRFNGENILTTNAVGAISATSKSIVITEAGYYDVICTASIGCDQASAVIHAGIAKNNTVQEFAQVEYSSKDAGDVHCVTIPNAPILAVGDSLYFMVKSDSQADSLRIKHLNFIVKKLN